MPKHRTQAEKRQAHQRHLRATPAGEVRATSSGSFKLPESSPAQKTTVQDLLSSDIRLLKRDILQSVVISLLLFAIIFGIVIFLNKA